MINQDKVPQGARKRERRIRRNVDGRSVMSSPVHDDGDRKLMYAPPWVRDQQHQDETGGSGGAISGIEGHPRQEPQPPASHAAANLQRSGTDREPKSIQLRTNEQDFDLDEPVQARLSSPGLQPTAMPPPPAHEAGLLNLGMGARVIGAVAVAAVVATVVTIAAQGPAVDGLAIFENAGAAVRPSRASVQADVGTAAPVQASQATQSPSASAQSGLANWPRDETPVTGPPPSEAVQKSQRIGLLDPANSTPPEMAAPRTHAADSLTREEMASMLKRGQDMIAAGDVASARLILFRVSEAGDAEATLTLARTFDADVLAKLNVVGARPDAAKARALYAKAAGQGSIEAKRRLDQSSR